MSFADIFEAFGAGPTVQFPQPIECPTCRQPARHAYLEWLQPCGHHVGEDWIGQHLSGHEPCTGLSAQWCPNHGTCRCPDRDEAMDSHDCPLHSRTSTHTEGTP